jgi:hypothetical protein
MHAAPPAGCAISKSGAERGRANQVSSICEL